MSNHLGFFKTACRDAERMVSILCLESTDLTKPRKHNSWYLNVKEKFTFFSRFFYMVLWKGFTPTIFDLLPFPVWYVLTLSIYGYRFTLLPLYLKLIGYGKYVDWNFPPLGSLQPQSHEIRFAPPKLSLSTRDKLSQHNYGDSEFEKMLACLYNKTAHLSPHSQSPGNPLVAGFPGNFMDHLIGVYKILVAWKQPVYVARAGLFHSVYGTFDYRGGCFDLRDGRSQLQNLVGPAAEELAFLICTSDRLGLLSQLYEAMYGLDAISRYGQVSAAARALLNPEDGNALPPLTGHLSKDGFPLRNHVTMQVHIIPASLFAQFMVVFCADFMDQGAQGGACSDMDICLFQFLRFRMFNDILRFVSPFLHVLPPVFQKYMWDKDFREPTREEVLRLKHIWKLLFKTQQQSDNKLSTRVTSADKVMLASMIHAYPYLVEPQVALAASLGDAERYKGYTKRMLADSACNLLEEWGTMAYKKTSMKEVLNFIGQTMLAE